MELLVLVEAGLVVEGEAAVLAGGEDDVAVLVWPLLAVLAEAEEEVLTGEAVALVPAVAEELTLLDDAALDEEVWPQLP